jgi:deoxyadenosine/deoxycytidine kinase
MIFTVEGNIGSGKTTLIGQLKSLKFNKPHIVVLEQVDEWCSLKDNEGRDILSLFYKDKQKYSYIFQSYVLFSRLHHLLV